MNENYIELKDADLEALRYTTTELLNSMELLKCSIYRHKDRHEFILTFPEGISNELFIFFYCALMAPGFTNSRDLLGWFYANDDMTIHEQSGKFSSFKSSTFQKMIMISPEGDEKGNMHQYGVTEDGREIHFGMDGTFKIQEKANLKYVNPISSLEDYTMIESIEKPIKETKTLFEKLKRLLGF